MDYKTQLGFYGDDNDPARQKNLLEYANLKLAARGCPIFGNPDDYPFLAVGRSLLASYREKTRLLSSHLCPADRSIHDFLVSYLGEEAGENLNWVPAPSLILDRHGLARTLSLPPDADKFESPIVSSYRVKQGICNNPQKDRRTTKGVFHVADGGLPVPADKRSVPKAVFANLLRHALNPPSEWLQLPFTATQEKKAETFVSLLVRPTVVPEVPGVIPKKSMEIRFFAPGNLVSNLDFVESIFGNAGDPSLTQNDARVDPDHWTGHTGMVILAPHLIELTKRELGLPRKKDATERQIKDGMCWEREDEKYNDGGAFKITCRDSRGVIATLIADNYFGYCKKEVKTQISYSANLFGLAEEEHAGGTLAFPSFDLGEDFSSEDYRQESEHRFEDVLRTYGTTMELQVEGYGIDKTYDDIYYLPDNVKVNLRQQTITWNRGGEQSLKLLPDITYILPDGYKIGMEKPAHATRWRLVGTLPEGTFCHKPCTVSGGGKSEISKSIRDAMISGPILVHAFHDDFDQAEAIINRDFGDRFEKKIDTGHPSRPLLSFDRSFGSVVQLLSNRPEHTDVYNEWVASIPRSVRDLVLVIKRFYKPHWGDDWRGRFGVDIINGELGHELKYRKQKLVASYIRVGFTDDGSWRVFGLRKDFRAADKIQLEDDISASVVVPASQLKDLHPELRSPSFKFVANCEYRLFQRPDEAIIRGYDTQAESDFTRSDVFFSNYEPLDRDFVSALVEDTIGFDEFTEPMKDVFESFIEEEKPDYVMSTAHPRLVDGVQTKNPRYLQNRPDLGNPRDYYLAELGARFHRKTPLERAVLFPVTSVLPGRRNNPPDAKAGIRALAVYNPLHYQEWPELFMDFIASLTGKSPSTTGAGSEGALTKGPFNALPAIIDLNNALVSYLLTRDPVFSSAAGYIGPKYRVDHDISLLIPEIWSRMFIDERDPTYLIETDCLERCEDFEHNGETIPASRLGWRITDNFVRLYFGRMFSDPTSVFDEEMLRPELQDRDAFADGVKNIVEAQQKAAQNYFEDDTIELACPPLKALLHIMAHGTYEGKDLHDPEIRGLFDCETLLTSEWYKARLDCKVDVDRRFWKKRVEEMEAMEDDPEEQLRDRLELARARLAHVSAPDYGDELIGTLGTDPGLYLKTTD